MIYADAIQPDYPSSLGSRTRLIPCLKLALLILPILLAQKINGQALVNQLTFSDHSEWCDIATGARFGNMVGIGDINNDGYDDIVVHSNGADNRV